MIVWCALMGGLIGALALWFYVGVQRNRRIWRAQYPDGLVSAKMPYDEAKDLVGCFGGKVVRAK